MQQECNLPKSLPKILHGLLKLSRRMEACRAGEALLDLVRARTSQINRAATFSPADPAAPANDVADPAHSRRAAVLRSWRWSPVFDARERAALAWAESLTEMKSGQEAFQAVSDLRMHFSDPEVMQLTLTIATINALNRVSMGIEFLESAKAIDRDASTPILSC
jgi:alkylhydroperoxidase family enzyme